MIVIENEYFKLEYDEANELVRHEYKTFLPDEILMNALNSGTELLIKHNCTKWLSDNRKVKTHTVEATKWINEDWLPRTLKAGWKTWGLIQPASVIASMNMKDFVKSFSEMGVEVKVFSEVDAAFEWIKNK